MRRARVVAIAGALALAFVGAPRAARADGAADVAAARELFNEASRLAAAGKWDEARDRYQRSLGLKRAAITMYSLGVAQKNTGRFVEAIENFRAFVSEPPTASTQPYLAVAHQAIAELAPRLARVSISIEPAGVPELVVTVDGERIPDVLLDRPRLVNPGGHDVKARGKGFAEAVQHVDVKEGGAGAVKLVLVPRPDEPAPAVVAPVATEPLAPRVDAPPPPPPSRALPIGLVVGGGIVFVGGVVVGMLGVAQASSAKTSDGPDASSARAKSAAGDVIGGLGIAAAATGVVILLTQKRPSPPPAAARAAAFHW